jgi:hypothetical protein
MSFTRSRAGRLALALGAAAGASSLLVFGGGFSCSKYSTFETVDCGAGIAPATCQAMSANCAAENAYDFQTIDEFKALSWFSSSDYTPPANAPAPGTSTSVATATALSVSGGTAPYTGRTSVAVVELPEGPVCGHPNAGVFRANYNYDWGGMYGMFGFSSGNWKDGSQYQGISFWARAPGASTKAFTFNLDDSNTMRGPLPDGTDGHCRSYSIDGGAAAGTNSNQPVSNDTSTGTPILGSTNSRAAYPDECGNGFTVVVTVSDEWAFYTLPFSAFHQSPSPNRVPNSALPADPNDLAAGTTVRRAELRQIGLRPPKGAVFDLWMAGLSFYREKVQNDPAAGTM